MFIYLNVLFVIPVALWQNGLICDTSLHLVWSCQDSSVIFLE